MKTTILQAIKPPAKIASLALVAGALLVPTVNIVARPHRAKSRPVIRVEIYNYAKMGRSELRGAEGQAAGLFAMAGVQIMWIEWLGKPASFRSLPDDPSPDFSVRILGGSGMMQKKQGAGVDVMGESIIPGGTQAPVSGGIANVYYDRVKEVSAAWAPSTSAILGEAIAHELGHLMLGPQHSRQGTMKILWTPQDQDLIAHCELRFLPGQAKDLQRAARSLHQDLSPSAD
jgi:hypothetical protein